MFSMPGIVIVDNDERELSQLQEAFYRAGLPCLPIQYIGDDPDNSSGIDHIDIPENLRTRILVSDLNLMDIQKLDATNLLAPLAKVLERLANSGPYMLVIWSKHKDEPERVMALLEERYKGKLTLPIDWALLSKTDFLVQNGEGDLEESTNRLKNKVQKLVEDSPIFHALLDWESRVSEAARRTTHTLFNLTAPQDNIGSGEGDSGYISQHQDNLKKVLSAIGNESVGHKNAKDFPAFAMDNGLAPVLSDQLLAISDRSEITEVWQAALPGLGLRLDLEDVVKYELNSFYHVEVVNNDYSKSCRGVFVELNGEYLSDSRKVVKLEKKLGRNLKTILYEEFINCKVGDKQAREDVREKIRIGFLEISAECDQAQQKIKLHRYIVGALVPQKFDKFTRFDSNGVVRDCAHDGIYRFPVISLSGEPYILKLSFKYQIGTQPDENQWFGQPIFRVRDQMLSDVTFNCSQYTSRPGITRFD